MDTFKIITTIEDMVENAPKFLGFVKMDEDRFFQLVSKLRASLPEDMIKVSQLAQDADKIREDAHGAANNHLEATKSEAEKMLAAARQEAERIQGEAQTEAERTLERARGVSLSLTEQSEIARIATAQAREIIAQAAVEAQETRAGADAYAHGVLVSLEAQVQRTLSQIEGETTALLTTIQRGRQELEKTTPSLPGMVTLVAPQRRAAAPDVRIATDRASDRELVNFGGRR